jgi:DNA recombination protein RmuC
MNKGKHFFVKKIKNIILKSYLCLTKCFEYMDLNILLILLLGVIIGAIMGWLFAKTQIKTEGFSEKEIAERFISRDAHQQLQDNFDILKDDSQYKEQEIRSLNGNLASASSEKQHLQTQLARQLEDFSALETRFQSQFENLANRLLNENSQKFTSHNAQQMEHILTPLREKIKGFEESIEKKYMDESRERHSLKNEIEQLRVLNTQLSRDAENLVLALKGDNKTQGNWGEFRLELLLEKAGLTKGIHFHSQVVLFDEENNKKQPDYIIQLPDNKQLVVDSKVSLVAYERYFSESDETLRKQHLKAHVDSLRAHIKNLSSKNYQQLYQINSPDYLLLFVPIEPAFTAALQEDQELFTEALEKNIVLVTTSTLLATMRTVSFLWKQDKQKQHVLEIARQSGMLYDKFVDFVEDLRKIGFRLDSAKDSFDDAMNKLVDAKRHGDTLIGKAEKIRALGARNAKLLPKDLVEASADFVEGEEN